MSEKRPQLSRRNALKIIAGSVSVAGSGQLLQGAGGCGLAHRSPDSGATHSPAYVPKFFNPEQMESLDLLSEVIIPQDEHSPGASAARVCDYIDVVTAESVNKDAKALWVDGLAAIDRVAEGAYSRKFSDCTGEQRRALVEKISAHEEHPVTIEERFFVAMKSATVRGYYTSAIGIHKDLEYQGNEFLPEFPGCQHPEHQA
jgi:hypothetical protein